MADRCQPDRREVMLGAAGLFGLALTPERAAAAASMATAADWKIAFADLDTDLAPRALKRVTGKAPAGLTGTLYRNGGAKFRRTKGEATHWFDGDGLIRAFRVQGDQATLAARFVDTPKRRADTVADAVISGGFGTQQGQGVQVSSPDDVNAANISVIRRGDKLWALWEAGSPFAIDPATLATTGMVTLRDDLAHMPFLAHPRFEPDGRIWNIGQVADRAVIWLLSPSGAVQSANPIALPHASYIHDFTTTERHIIIVLQPWIYEGQSNVPMTSLAWRPDVGTKVLILDKSDLSARRVVELPTFFAFHMTSAWEDPLGEIRFEICASPEPDFVTRTAVDLMTGTYTPSSDPKLSLITIPARGAARIESMQVIAEFPRTDGRGGGPNRFTLHATKSANNRPLFQGVGVYDWSKNRDLVFDFGPDHLVEEMVFTPRPGSVDAFDGWIIGPTINLRDARTELHVFDARHIDAGPLVTWAADVAVPAGLHGMFWRG